MKISVISVLGFLAGLAGVMVATPAVAECYVPPVLNCLPGTVPGWLNEHGDPTGCVDDHPCVANEFQDWDCNPVVPAEPVMVPEEEVPPTVVAPVPTQPEPDVTVPDETSDVPLLAETGLDGAMMFWSIIGLMFVGGVCAAIAVGRCDD